MAPSFVKLCSGQTEQSPPPSFPFSWKTSLSSPNNVSYPRKRVRLNIVSLLFSSLPNIYIITVLEEFFTIILSV